MNPRTTLATRLPSLQRGAHRAAAGVRRPAVLLAAAACGALGVSVLSAGEPAAHAATGTAQPVSVAAQLGLTPAAKPSPAASLRPLQDLTAGRAQRSDAPSAGAMAQAAADPKNMQVLAQAADSQAQLVAQQQADAAAKAAADAQAQAAAQAAAAVASATPSSFQSYAQSKLGDASQFSCLESLWGKESGWNPNAHNPSSSAYGIPQFLDSTWASTGIGKTSDGYRQIDAGLIYIQRAYGSPCGAWAHSRADNWY